MSPKDEISKHFKLTARQRKALEKLGLFSVEDLLRHFPQRYEHLSGAKKISELLPGESVSVYGKISELEKKLSWKSKRYVVYATLQDSGGTLNLMWFNQPYVENMLKSKPYVKVSGKIFLNKNELCLANPMMEILPAMPEFEKGRDEFVPIYKESAGISSRWFFYAVKKVLSALPADALEEALPEKIVEKYKLPTLKSAIYFIHFPKNEKQLEAARKRFAFEEVFFLQIARQKEKLALKKQKAVRVQINEQSEKELQKFIKSFAFELTDAQKRAIEDIKADFKKGHPAARLLEGDVGSGKTAVAAAGVFLVYLSKSENNKFKSLQSAYMAPTEILAKQIFEEFIKFFYGYNVKIAFVSSKNCMIYPSKSGGGATKVSCAQVKKWIKEGIIQVVIGTHSLIFKSVEFENLAFVIVDEQHRFGTRQRAALARKDGARPHLLSMSATPMPRTLALSIYGDLDLSVLDELPKGRKPVVSKIVKKDKRDEVYEFVKSKLKEGRQAYVICPRIEEPDPEKANALRAKSVEEEVKRLSEGPFKGFKLSALHGKMKESEKDAVMKDFAEGKSDILVATSVVEVGVNVPNATIIIIEGAERFGLSQLHQLRGRVRRSKYDAYCFLFPETFSEKTAERLKVIENSSDGFELAEKDLALRGPGELDGSKQWGLSDIGMRALQNIKMVEFARKEAANLLKRDPELEKHPKLAEKIKKANRDLHLE